MKSQFNFVALDIETTGFDFQKNEIIEIGAVRFVEGQKKDDFSIFIKPQTVVPAFIKQLTHITDEQLSSGVPLKTALISLKDYLQDDTIVCHNNAFDIGFINKKLEMNDLSKLTNKEMDTLDLSRIYLPFIVNHKLETVSEYFKIDLENAHRAIFDAEATGYILLKIMEFIDENIPLQLNFKLLEISQYADHSTSFFLEKVVAFQKKTCTIK